MPHLTFLRMALATLSLTAILQAAPLTVPLSTFTPAVLAELPASERATARLEIILLPSLTTSLTAVTGPSSNGEAQSRILPPEVWVPGAPFTFEVAGSAAGRVHVGYRALSADSSRALTPYRILQVSGEPTALFYGNAEAEPIHMGLMRLQDGGGLGLLTLGAPVGREIQVSVRKPGGIFALVNMNLITPPATCATGISLTALMSAWTASHTLGLIRQADGMGGMRHTLVYALPAADLADAPRLEFTVTERATGKLLADGPMGALTLPSVRQWVDQYDTRLRAGAPSAPAATRLGLFCIALRGLAHADAKRPGFDFLQADVHFADYAQMATVFNAALEVPASTPLGRLNQVYAAVRAVNQNPLQDPVSLSLKTPKDNVVFAEGYTLVEFDSRFAPASVSAWPEAPGTRDLRLLLIHSKNIALYRRDRAKGPYVFAPLLPVEFDSLPPAAGTDPNAVPDADAITLPITGPSLRALLRDGLYVRGNPVGIAQPQEPFLLDIRVIRDTTLAAVPRAQLQAMAAGFLPSAGSVISGPENSAFQIWPVVNENGTGKYIKDARYGHYMNRGQTRALAYAYEYKLGTGVMFRVDGPDSAKLSAKTPTKTLGEGKKMRLLKTVKSGGAVGTGLDGLLFRAVDYTVNEADESDTTVLRVFEKKGTLFGLGMVVSSAGSGGSPDGWPVQVKRDAVSPVGLFYGPGVGLPEPLRERGSFEVWLDEDVRLYSSLAEQNEGTRLNDNWNFQLIKNSKKKSFYSFQLNDPVDYSALFSPTSGVTALQSMVAGGQGNKSVRFVYRPKGESGRYLEEALTTEFNPVNCRARIAGDFDKDSENKIDEDDFNWAGPHQLRYWFSEWTPASLRTKGTAGANNYKVTMDMVPIKLVAPSSNRYTTLLKNKSNNHLMAQPVTSNDIYNQNYLFDLSLAPALLEKLDPFQIQNGNHVPVSTPSAHRDTISFLIAGDKSGSGHIYAQVENDGLSANTDSLLLTLYDFNGRIAIYSARYKLTPNLRDELAKVEGIDTYLWEAGNTMNHPEYGETTYLTFPLNPVHNFDGRRFADVHKFDVAQPLMIYTHGFNSQEELDKTFLTEKTIFKKMCLSGFTGNFLGFHWYGNFHPKYSSSVPVVGGLATSVFEGLLFSMDQLNAFKSSSAFLSLMKDTLAAFPNKQIIAHSLGNQMVLDMLRQNMYAGVGGGVADIGLSKYIILEAAVAKSVFYNIPDGRNLANWRGLFMRLPSQYPDLRLHHLRKSEDYAVKWFFRANETIKKLPDAIWRRINTAAVLLDDLDNATKDNRVFFCKPDVDGLNLRLPRDLAECYTTSPGELFPQTLPQNGIDESQWPGRIEYQTTADYDSRDWKTADSHSWLNLDENYKTKSYVDDILR